MVTSAEDRFQAFIMRHVKSLGTEVYIGCPRAYAHELGRYVVLTHAGIKDEDEYGAIPPISDYDDAMALLRYQIDKYCAGAKRIIIRTKPEIRIVSADSGTGNLYATYFRLLADDGKEKLRMPWEKIK